MVYLMPSFQNPTGRTMSMERRRAVMDVVKRAQVPVIEEDFSTELRYRGRPMPPLKALDEAGQVVLLGTFSKMLCPGLRVGWLLAPPGLRRPLLELKRLCDLATSLPSQMALAAFVGGGDLDRHLDVVRGEHGNRLQAMLEAIEQHLPETVEPTIPEGGLTLWLRLPDGANSDDLAEDALAKGVWIAPGTLFSPTGGGHDHVRLSFVGEPPERIDEGMAVLGQVLTEHMNRPQKRSLEKGLVV
jgi:2-aminoadipate transaminase